MRKRQLSYSSYEGSERYPNKRQRFNKEYHDYEEQSVFSIVELVEKIISYLFNASKTILSISILSKRHYNIVHSRALWLNLGFTQLIGAIDPLPGETIRFILHKLRIQYLRRKTEDYFSEIKKLSEYEYGADLTVEEPVLAVIAAEAEDNFTLEFFTNTVLTDEACKVLLYMVGKAPAIALRLSEMIEFITCTEEQLRARYGVIHEARQRDVKVVQSDWIRLSLFYYPNLINAPSQYHPLFLIEPDGLAGIPNRVIFGCSVWKVFIDKHKSVTFFYSRLTRGSPDERVLSFVKYNSQTNRIEICANFEHYAIRAFGTEMKDINRALAVLLEVDEPENEAQWKEDFEALEWKLDIFYDFVRDAAERTWFQNETIKKDIKFFRD